MKLMRKTHKTVLTNKQNLIQDLQEVITDKEEYISELETRLQQGGDCASMDKKV